jgi:hypothetical protein
MGLLEPIIVLAAVAAVAWLLFSPRFEFRIRISRGSLRLTTGKLTRDLIAELTPICQEWGIKRGWIAGVRRGKRVTLMFSRSVPSACRQQIRNLWINR